LIRLALRCRAAEAEEALAELLELAPSGIEEVSEPGGERGVVEYAVYGAEGELPELGALRAAAGDALVEIRSERVPADWAERWKRFYHPLLIGGKLYLRPPWERPAERGGVTEVVIDPGRAFGTGTHATTAMCLELLLGEAPPRHSLGRAERRSLCDLGSGSGVLAIAGAKLGFDPVVGVDADRSALEETARNARLNFVEVELRHLDLRTQLPPPTDVVTANLTARLVEALCDRWSGSGARPARVIASGFLLEESEGVAGALGRAGFDAVRSLERGDWGALLATLPLSDDHGAGAIRPGRRRQGA
jgi:ribosomal protein L11 methyltransferase